MKANGVVSNDRGPAIQLRSGKMFYLLDPRPEDFEIEDIAAALAKINRYTGHTSVPFSVAQHSVMASEIAEPGDELWALLHDGAEAFVGDISSPLKRALKGVVAVVEEPILKCVIEKYGLSWPMPASVHHIDMVMLSTEKRCLMAQTVEWPGLPEPLAEKITPWPWKTAEARFLRRFWHLMAAREERKAA